MRFTLFLVGISLCASYAMAEDEYVNGYMRQNGTYVQGYHKSKADSNPYNNYSTVGNVNPYTGKEGTIQPDSGYGTGSHHKKSVYGY